MTARNNASLIAAELSKDTGFHRVTIDIDPNGWSTRRRNIILRALKHGITQCGYETGYFIKCLTEAYGSSIVTMHNWTRDIPASSVDPDKFDELIAYTCAWIKLKAATMTEQESNYFCSYTLNNWLNNVSKGNSPSTFPTPDISNPTEKALFIKQYLKKDETELEFREALAAKIQRGEMLSISMNAR
jgi:hypothetical protein